MVFVLAAGPHNQQVVSTASRMGTLMCNAMAAAARTISPLWRMNIVIMLLGSSSLTCLNSVIPESA
ncbi:hypothetical protein BDA96_07G144600 [Sorghum bicolor]|uniref:Uncharacterized protein n=2 Tax=Sorghum bicolor TaxID=4558 RepID=A0A921UAJ5_SORBI|nr:hypothetical protein BDA96_07G144600 [Sorghum bicolor]OQU80496.1 hypothetical protein SORBI_3007G134501 [Sorghum bicolor]